MTIRSIAALVAAALALSTAAPVFADETYLRESDAPKVMYPESTGSERLTLELSETELKTLDRMMARRIDATKYPYLEVRKQNEIVGLVFLLDVIGQSRPISFAVAVASGALHDVEVLVYREPQGEQINEARFRRQFVGKRWADPIALGKDIDVISGATISARAVTYAVRKALALAEILRARAAVAAAR